MAQPFSRSSQILGIDGTRVHGNANLSFWFYLVLPDRLWPGTAGVGLTIDAYWQDMGSSVHGRLRNWFYLVLPSAEFGGLVLPGFTWFYRLQVFAKTPVGGEPSR